MEQPGLLDRRSLCAYNWIDALWLGKGPPLESGMEMSSQGLPLFQLAYRF